MLIQLFYITFKNGKLYNPYHYKNQKENPKVTEESKDTVLHPVAEICHRHHDKWYDQKINSCLFDNAPVFQFPDNRTAPEADSQYSAQ